MVAQDEPICPAEERGTDSLAAAKTLLRLLPGYVEAAVSPHVLAILLDTRLDVEAIKRVAKAKLEVGLRDLKAAVMRVPALYCEQVVI